MHPVDEPTQHTYPTGQYGRPVSAPPQQLGPQEYSTAQFSPPTGFPPVTPRRKKRGRKAELVAVAVVVLIAVGIGVAYAVAKSGTPSAAPSAAAARQPANVACEHGTLANGACAAGQTYADPGTTDFQLSLKILKKECFGSAGCNVGFRVELQYTGSAIEPNSEWDVTYDITGAEDPYTATMTVTFDGNGQPSEYSQDDGEMVQTPKSSSKLTITTTAVAKH